MNRPSKLARTTITLAAGSLIVAGTSTTAAASSLHAHWTFDEVDSAVAYDASGLGNHGTNHDVTGDGDAYSFNGVSSRVVVPDADSLDPGTADFAFGVTLSMPAPPAAGDTYDILRKGLVSTSGGNYKLEVKNAKGKAVARCVVKDAAKVTAARQSQLKVNLADGKVHTVTCTKTSTGVTVQVDALPPVTRSVTSLGSVSNAAELAIGAKAGTSASTGFDWYLGKVHDAWLAVG